MNHAANWVCGLGVAVSLFGCSGGAGAPQWLGHEDNVSSIALQLTTVAPSGSSYRLGPASFTIIPDDGSPPLHAEATGGEEDLHVSVDHGGYIVVLNPDWTLQKIGGDGGVTPITATLLAPAEQRVFVEPFRSSPVSFAFHLGQSGIDIGISVDEGVPEGYDGKVTRNPDGGYSVEFAGGGVSCCWSTADEAQHAFGGRYYVANP